MSNFQFKNGLLYRMPAHFGPTPGPRQGPDNQAFDWRHQPKRTLIVARYLSDSEAIQQLLPEGFTVDGEPIVSVEIQYWSQLEWLAGRGYNTLGVKFPVRFKGAEREWRGHFLSVIWENMPDAIISGREELGYNKIFAEIPPPRIMKGARHHHAEWFGHRFMELNLSELEEIATQGAPKVPHDGIFNYKYIPRTGCPGEADASYVTLTPPTGGHTQILKCFRGQVDVRFIQSTWEQLPTTYHIVNALAALPVVEIREGFLVESVGAKDLSDQTIIE